MLQVTGITRQTASEHHNAGGHAAEPNVFSPLYVMSGKLREASAK